VGLLDRFEKGIERAVNGAFAKAFRSEVQPVEIASALRRELDDRATVVARDRTLVPNSFVVELGQADHGRLGEWEEALAGELAAVAAEHALQQRYAFVGTVEVTFEEADDLDTGVFRVRSATKKAPTSARPAAAAGAPAAAPAPPPAAAVPPPQAPPAGPAGVPTLDVGGRLYRLVTPVTVIGRTTDADITLDDTGVSRRHAEVHVQDGVARVIDLGSTNGTFLDGERIHAGQLANGSTITVGRTRLVFHLGTG
jgi:hypothetical protein